GQSLIPAESLQTRERLQKSQCIRPLALAEQRSQTRAQVVAISAENLVGALTIEHHLDPGGSGCPEYLVLRICAGATEGLVLNAHHGIEISGEVAGRGAHFMNVRSGFPAHDVNPAFFADGLVIRNEAESVNLSLTIQVTNRHHDGRRINAAGERGAERYVAAQMHFY